jgi:hypothetical protein
MTTYYYVTQILSGPGGTVVDQSSDCSFDTLVPVPAASCSAATDLAATTMTLNGAATNTVAGNVVRFRYGTATGVYTITTAEQGAAASFTEAVTGLTTLTDYFYVAEILDAAGGTVISTSAECTGTTTAAPVGLFAASTDTTGSLGPALTIGVGDFIHSFSHGGGNTTPNTSFVLSASSVSSTHGGETLNEVIQVFTGNGVNPAAIATQPFTNGAGVIVVPAAEAAGWAAGGTTALWIAGRSFSLSLTVAGPYTTTSAANAPRNAGGRQIAVLSIRSAGVGITPVVMSSIPAGWQEITDFRYRALTPGGNTIDMLAFVGPYLLSPSFDTTIDYTAAGNGSVSLQVYDIS